MWPRLQIRPRLWRCGLDLGFGLSSPPLPASRLPTRAMCIATPDQLEGDLSEAARQRVEDKWRQQVLHAHEEVSSETRPQDKYYVLPMFPYPSGALHMGHVRVYSLSDAMARFQRMNGKQVIHPIGWDAFGLPAENAARAHGVDAGEWTRANIRRMRATLRRLGCSFDWRREISTTHPDYFRWTQWLFVRLARRGLAYRKEAEVLWDPVDGTVLAEEQVDDEGRAWRSGALAERRRLRQWFLRTRAFAHSLLEGLDDASLENWKDVRALQAHWLGACDGVLLELALSPDAADGSAGNREGGERVDAWTARPEAAAAARFVAVRADGALAQRHPGPLRPSAQGLPAWRRLPLRAVSPLTGAVLPVLAVEPPPPPAGDDAPASAWWPWEGEDARLGVPRVCPAAAALAAAANLPPAPGEDDAQLTFPDQEARESAAMRVVQDLQSRGAGGHRCSARLKDWLVSRQRAWGTPIPAVHCDACGAQPVAEEELPVTPAPPPGTDEHRLWKETRCPSCGGPASRDTDTMDTFVDSSWYFLRFLDPRNEHQFCEPAATKLMPVDLYVGGKEHAVLHLYYARFMMHFLHSEGLVPCREPFQRLLPQGMVMGQAYRLRDSGRYLPPEEVDTSGKKPVERASGLPVEALWEKMSKSKFNGVDPEGLLDKYGCDSVRLFMLADVAPMSHRNWSSKTFPGVLKWQRRVWLTVQSFVALRRAEADGAGAGQPLEESAFRAEEERLRDSRNYYVRGATFHFCETMQISVAISKAQGLTGALRRTPPSVCARSREYERALAALLRLMTPLAPHLASELWAAFAAAHPLHQDLSEKWRAQPALRQPWPLVDADYALPLDITVEGRGQEMGCVRLLPAELYALDAPRALELALAQPKVTALTRGRAVRRAALRHFPHCGAELRIALEGAPARESEGEPQGGKAEAAGEAAEEPRKKQKRRG